MADPRPLSNDEKNFLLAEIIKQTSPLLSVLFNAAMNCNPQPRWEDLALPSAKQSLGRSLNTCRNAFEELKRAPSQQYAVAQYGPQTPLSAPLSAPPHILKRPFPHEAPFTGRIIAPRPTTFGPSVAGGPSVSDPAPKRRRGRPPKAETQAKEAAAAAAAAASRHQAGPAPLQAPLPLVAQQSVSTPVSATEEARSTQSAPTRMPISAVLTPVVPHTASSSSGSSGKRRRGRSLRNEPEGSGSGGPSGHAYESPYGRAMAPLEDTPARAAVMRHREEQLPYEHEPQPGPSGPGAESGQGPSSA
ncbi:hypothetical protein LTR56_027130 [Elasticomyces elasticus]|nr:hypothetical protein LTR56_027130 [Elasticomyces elasticus]KAK3616155.1 hypothetical protein LTR22_027171 [Elasticomyces elasticus]KAK4915340.1 hypothetical protein LTR49_016471 [Elasticomyces elasticus]KAK5734122.1 hypothetical protein LTS12_026777 [Elasticomyces elasticus]